MVNMVLLIGLVKILLITDKPVLCASIYVGVGLFLHLLSGTPIINLLIPAVISFFLAAAYFWLLDNFQESNLPFYAIMIVGLLISFV
jgi:hypothetical protein